MKLQDLQEAKYHLDKQDEIRDVVDMITSTYADNIYDNNPPDTNEQRLDRIYRAIDRTANELGYTFDDWDLKKAAEVVYDKFF